MFALLNRVTWKVHFSPALLAKTQPSDKTQYLSLSDKPYGVAVAEVQSGDDLSEELSSLFRC